MLEPPQTWSRQAEWVFRNCTFINMCYVVCSHILGKLKLFVIDVCLMVATFFSVLMKTYLNRFVKLALNLIKTGHFAKINIAKIMLISKTCHCIAANTCQHSSQQTIITNPVHTNMTCICSQNEGCLYFWFSAEVDKAVCKKKATVLCFMKSFHNVMIKITGMKNG